MIRRQDIIQQIKRRPCSPPFIRDYSPYFWGSGTWSDYWYSADSRWALNGSGYLWLNYTDWNSDYAWLKPRHYIDFSEPGNKIIIEYTHRRETGSTMWDQESGIFCNSGNITLVYFNGAATTANFIGNSFTFQGLTGSDNYVYVELEDGLQKCWVNNTLYKTLNLSLFGICYFNYFRAKNQVKFTGLKITANRWL